MPESLRNREDSKRDIPGTLEKGNRTASPEEIWNIEVGEVRGSQEKVRGRGGGHGGAGRLIWGKSRGELDERYHNSSSHCRFEERSGTSESSRDLPG